MKVLALAIVLAAAAGAPKPAKVSPPSPTPPPKSDLMVKTNILLDTPKVEPDAAFKGIDGLVMFGSQKLTIATGSLTPYTEDAGDLFIRGSGIGHMPRGYSVFSNPGSGKPLNVLSFKNLGKVNFTDQVDAPERGYNLISDDRFSGIQDVKADDVVVFKMKEQATGRVTFGKIHFRLIGFPITMLDYVWQRNGSRTLED